MQVLSLCLSPVSSYRPANLTSVCGKIMENIFWGRYWKTLERQCSHWSQPTLVHEGKVLFNKLNSFSWQDYTPSWPREVIWCNLFGFQQSFQYCYTNILLGHLVYFPLWKTIVISITQYYIFWFLSSVAQRYVIFSRCIASYFAVEFHFFYINSTVGKWEQRSFILILRILFWSVAPYLWLLWYLV